MSNPFESFSGNQTKKEYKQHQNNPFDSFSSPQEEDNSSSVDNGKNDVVVSFDTLINHFKSKDDVTSLVYVDVLESLKSTLSSKNLQEVNNILVLLSKTDDNQKIAEYINKLQDIARRHEEEKDSVRTEARDGGEEIKAENIENHLEFIKSLLIANDSFLDGSLTRVNTLVEEAAVLSEQELLEKLAGNPIERTWSILDVEPEDWELYFEEHDIPEEKQSQLKKYYAELMEHKDFGNILPIFNDFGDKIADEARRIHSLPDGVEITINIDSLNPSDGTIKFESKKDALLYLYYNKVLLREVATFMEDIIVGVKNLGKGIVWAGEFARDHISEIIIALMAYMGLNTFGTFVRKTSAFLVRKRYNQGFVPTALTLGLNRLAVGEYLYPSTSPLEGEESRENAEIKAREKYIEMLEKRYRGNPKKLQQIKKARKYIRVLDHNIDSSEEEVLRVAEIDRQISEKREQLEGLDKSQKLAKKRLNNEISKLKKQRKKYARKLYRFSESTFWRQVSYIENGSWKNNKYIDTLLKPWLSNSESDSIDRLNRTNKLFDQVKRELFDESGEKIGILKQAENYLRRSHDIPNVMEKEVERFFNEYVNKLKNGEFGDIEGEDKKNLLEKIKASILEEIKDKTGLALEANIFEEGNSLDNAKVLFFDGYKDFEPERGTNKKNKWVENIFKDDTLSDIQLSEIKKFFAEIEKGTNQYNQRTALDIVARIIKNNLTYKQAIDESFKVKWDHIKKIDVNSDFKGSLENLLNSIDSIDSGSYSLEVNDSTKRPDIDRSRASSSSEADSLGDREEEEELSEKQKVQKAELQRMIDEINSVDSLEELKKLKIELNKYIKADGIDSSSSYYIILIEKFNIDLEAKKLKLELDGVDIYKKTEELRKILDAVKIELLMKGKDSELDRLDQEYRNINNRDELSKMLTSVVNFKDYYKNKFSLSKLRTIETLKRHLRKLDYSKLPDGIKSPSDLIDNIDTLRSTNVWQSVLDSIKSLRLTR